MVDLNTEVQQTETLPPPDPKGERLSVRESLERSFEEARDEPEEREREPRERIKERKVQSRKSDVVEPEQEVEQPEQASEEVEEQTQVQPTTEAQPPSAWTKDAKAAWDDIPNHVKAAITKREADVEKGVKELKDKYSEFDKAVAPHLDEIKRFNKTPGQAVAQIFQWFEALSKNPDQAFPALIQSYGYDPRKIAAAFGLNQTQQAQPQVKPEQEAEPEVEGEEMPSWAKTLKDTIEQTRQQQYYMQQNFAEQSLAKTHELLETWAKEKPYFQDVRIMMGHLLTPDPNTGVAAIPLKDGRIDLDAAYDAAIWARPDIRAKILADETAKADAARKAKQTQEAKLQSEQAAKAKRAAGSISPQTPSGELSKKPVTKGKTVKQSIRDAMEELSS